jgi:hypothetical protein
MLHTTETLLGFLGFDGIFIAISKRSIKETNGMENQEKKEQ